MCGAFIRVSHYKLRDLLELITSLEFRIDTSAPLNMAPTGETNKIFIAYTKEIIPTYLDGSTNQSKNPILNDFVRSTTRSIEKTGGFVVDNIAKFS